MIVLTFDFYRHLLDLYPANYRDEFGEEMTAVFRDMQAETAAKGTLARSAFYIRETAGAIVGALREHFRVPGREEAWLLFPPKFFRNRRLTMHTEFRFPKATAVLMAIILAGVMAAIKMGEGIVASVPHVSEPVGTIHPVHSVLLGGVVMMLAMFYAAGLIGWVILFAMRRSGVHRLETSGESK